MDTEQGDTIYTEATIHRTVLLRCFYKNESGTNVLTVDEARALANSLLIAAAEAEQGYPA
jgi:hypothetical protein